MNKDHWWPRFQHSEASFQALEINNTMTFCTDRGYQQIVAKSFKKDSFNKHQVVENAWNINKVMTQK